MTFKELAKAVQSQQQSGPELSTIPKDIPFWIFDKEQHRQEDIRTKGQCCFWHIIKPPQKDGRDMPVLGYQRTLYEALQNHKHIWCLKSRGIGVTTFLLRYIAWCCMKQEHFNAHDRVCIITGPRIDLAEDLIARFKDLFSRNYLQNNHNDRTQSTVAFLNGVRCEAFPSHHVDTMRGLDNVRFIMSDETDMYPVFQQRELRAVMEGYIGKPNSNPTIILVSTPNAPNGLMQQIELEPDSLYFKLRFDYRYGLEGEYPIYSQDQIQIAKRSPEFGREMECRYIGAVGNVFSQASIENCQKIEYNPMAIVPDAPKSCGIDPAYGSSNFAITVTQLVDGKIQVIEASEWTRPGFNEMIEKVWELKNKCGHISNIYVDASNPSFIQQLKKEFDEPFDDQYVRDKQSYCRKHNLHIENFMFVCPTPFSIENKRMISNAKWLMDEKEEDGTSLIAIHPSFDKLLISLRTASVVEWRLQKDQVSFNDILDSFLMALQYYKRTK